MNARSKNIIGSLFCFIALVSWGMGSQRLLASIVMGALITLAAVSPYRIHPSAKAKSRANDLTLVIITISTLWFYLQRQSLPNNLAIHLLSFCPIFLYPKLLFGFLLSFEPDIPSQTGSSRDGVVLAKRWLEVEFAFSRRHLDKRRSISFQDIFFFLSIFVASFSLPPNQGPILAIVATLSYCLAHAWHPRQSNGLSIALALLACFFCLLGTTLGSVAIQKGQEYAEEYYSQLWSHRPDGFASANSTDTSIGRRGKLDNGNRLVMRLEWSKREAQNYLRNGIFTYTPNGTTWFSTPPSRPTLEKPLLPSESSSFLVDTADAISAGEPVMQAKISTTFNRERSALALPIGTHEIFGLPLAKLDMNVMGIATTSGSQGFVKFGLTFAPKHDSQPKPDAADTEVPQALIPAIDQFLDESKARGTPPAQAAALISSYFKTHWTYTLNLQDRSGNARSLSNFLLRDREGHCEYFATATTLALRRLGFPARYSTGYLVNEFDERENLYWIRTRDAHAWSSVWDGKQWSLIDSTPGGPPEDADWTSAGSDFFSRLQYMLEDFDPASITQRINTRGLIIAGILMLCFLAYRLRIGKANAAGAASTREAVSLSQAMARLAKNEPDIHESYFEYWRRLSPLFATKNDINDLASLRERALFMPVEDRTAALAECERRARLIRRSLRLAARST